MKNCGNIFNIQHFSLNDGPGIRTVVFFKGCRLNCAWCHNPESKSQKQELSLSQSQCILCERCVRACRKNLHTFKNSQHFIDRSECDFCGECVKACGSGALKIIGKFMSVRSVMDEIAKDDIFFGSDGGITFSGGEPFMQFDFLLELLKNCRQKGYSTCIETSGCTSTENILEAAKYTDYFLFDCKETDVPRHIKYVGIDNKLILKNLNALNGTNAHVALRCPIIPDVNNNITHILKIAEIANNNSCIESVEFMPYHPLGLQKCKQINKECRFLNSDFLDKEDVNALLKQAEGIFNVPTKIN